MSNAASATGHHARADLLARRRRAAEALRQLDAVVLVGAGLPIGLPGGQDQTYDFLPHPDYRWLSGRDMPDGIMAWDSRDGDAGWVDFVPEVSELERVWEGRQPVHDPHATPRGEFDAWLARRSGRSILALGVPPAGVAFDEPRSRQASERLLHARRPKDASEIALVEAAIRATAKAYERLREVIRPGVTEREVGLELEHAAFRHGIERMGYGTIVGSGPNAAVLHFAPSSRVIEAKDLVLVDAGGAIGGYTADVTRTYAASGRLEGVRGDLHAAVLDTERRAVARCRPGTTWREVHTGAALDLASALVTMGVLRGNPQSLVEREAIALFFPHGIGHMVGLGVRDAGGRLPGAAVGPTCCGVTLRVDLPLEAGYLMTVEPGLYFIAALLEDRARRERFADCVDWSTVDRLLADGVGGVRLEDNVLVTSGGPRNLTGAIPM